LSNAMLPPADSMHLFAGKLLLCAPHMDDCVLGCGGMLARLVEKKQIHVVYATDGARSPLPPGAAHDTHAELASIRVDEARQALGSLGVPSANLHFLALPDGTLAARTKDLVERLAALVMRVEPAHILGPFRFDRHCDHVALNGAIREVISRTETDADFFEYFVYYRWRLLPAGDIREYIWPEQVYKVDIGAVSKRKRQALDYFRSQTTRYFPWQSRPILTPQLLDEVSQGPEWFLRYDPTRAGTRVFRRHTLLIRLANILEPVLKKGLDRIRALAKIDAR